MSVSRLESAYYISQLIVAIAVVLSLIFVSLHIRQNTKIMLETSYAGSINMVYQLWTTIADNQELADIHRQGSVAFDKLNELEQYRASLLAAISVDLMHAAMAGKNLC